MNTPDRPPGRLPPGRVPNAPSPLEDEEIIPAEPDVTSAPGPLPEPGEEPALLEEAKPEEEVKPQEGVKPEEDPKRAAPKKRAPKGSAKAPAKPRKPPLSEQLAALERERDELKAALAAAETRAGEASSKLGGLEARANEAAEQAERARKLEAELRAAAAAAAGRPALEAAKEAAEAKVAELTATASALEDRGRALEQELAAARDGAAGQVEALRGELAREREGAVAALQAEVDRLTRERERLEKSKAEAERQAAELRAGAQAAREDISRDYEAQLFHLRDSLGKLRQEAAGAQAANERAEQAERELAELRAAAEEKEKPAPAPVEKAPDELFPAPPVPSPAEQELAELRATLERKEKEAAAQLEQLRDEVARARAEAAEAAERMNARPKDAAPPAVTESRADPGLESAKKAREAAETQVRVLSDTVETLRKEKVVSPQPSLAMVFVGMGLVAFGIALSLVYLPAYGLNPQVETLFPVGRETLEVALRILAAAGVLLGILEILRGALHRKAVLARCPRCREEVQAANRVAGLKCLRCQKYIRVKKLNIAATALLWSLLLGLLGWYGVFLYHQWAP